MSALSSPDSKRGRLQRECLEQLRAHEQQGEDGLPTSCRFIYYELVKDGIIPKDKRNSGRQPSQDVSEAILHLRQTHEIPWTWIVDETRSLTSYRCGQSIADYLRDTVDQARIDAWDGEPPPMIITESRSLGGVLDRLVYEYVAQIAPTNGQAGGFLYTDVGPALVAGQKVLYLGDFDWQGEQIEANTRRVLEGLVGELDWERIALTEEQVQQHNLPVMQKADRRYRPPRYHDAVECEALEQAFIVGLVRERLDALLPEPLVVVRRREAQQRRQVRTALARLGRLS